MADDTFESANLTLPKRIKFLANLWAKTNGETLSGLVSHLLREHLKSRGIDPEIPVDQFLILAKKAWEEEQAKPKGLQGLRERIAQGRAEET